MTDPITVTVTDLETGVTEESECLVIYHPRELELLFDLIEKGVKPADARAQVAATQGVKA